MEDVSGKSVAKVMTGKASKQTKQKFCSLKLCCLEISLRCDTSSPKEAQRTGTEGINWAYKIVYK